MFYRGDKHLWWPPESRGYTCSHGILKSDDATELDTLFCPATAKTKSTGNGIVVQFHGNAQNITSHYLQLIWLTEHGFDFATFDYRGYGNSAGISDGEGIYRDARAYVRHIRQTYPSQRRLFYGQSLGGTILMRALVDEGLRKGEIYIFEGTFSSYQRMGRQFLSNRWFLWPFQWLAYLLVSDSRSAESELSQFNSFPVIIIHGEHDPVIPLRHGEIVAEKMGKPLWLIPGGRHLGVWRKGNEANRDELLRQIRLLSATP